MAGSFQFFSEILIFRNEEEKDEQFIHIKSIPGRVRMNCIQGDDWMFTIHVQKIEELHKYKKPEVIKEKGQIEQYPDYEDEEYDEFFDEDFED